MQNTNRWMIAALMVLAALALVACGDAPASATVSEPAQIEPIEGSEFNRVILTEKAAERLDIQTALVQEEQVNGAQRLVVPYGAVLYSLYGETWVYVSPEPLVFVREPITVDYVKGDIAVLLAGPPVDTEVAMVGVAELYGIDTGVGK